MIRFDDVAPTASDGIPPADGRSRTISAARHVRSFTEGEVLSILAEAVKRQAGHDEAKVTGTAIRLVSPRTLDRITIQVDVSEISR